MAAPPRPAPGQKPLKFYDLKAKKAFVTDQYDIIPKETPRGIMLVAVTRSPYTGTHTFRIVGWQR